MVPLSQEDRSVDPGAQGAIGSRVEVGTPVTGQDELRQKLRWSWRVLWRGKALVLACLLLVMVPAILAVQQMTPRYTAEARIMVEAAGVRNPLEERDAAAGWLNEPMVQTEADLLSSTVLARRAVAKLHLLNDPEFNGRLQEEKPIAAFLSWFNPWSWLPAGRAASGEEAVPALVRERMELAAVTGGFLGRLSVRVPRRSFIISVQYTSENPEKAALIANTLAELYVDDRLETSFDEARRVTTWLGERLETLRHDLSAAETAAEEFRAANGLRRVGDQAVTLKDHQLSELSSRFVIARAELAQKRARLDQARGLIHSQGGAEATNDVLQSPLIQALRAEESRIQREMSDALKTYGDRHPRILGSRADQESLHSKIAHEVTKIAGALANDVDATAAGIRSLEEELERTRRQTDLAGGAEVKLRELERQAQAGRAVYEAFLTRFKREAEQGQIRRANARVISAAEIPTGPSYPAKRSSFTLAFMLALAAGIGLVFLLDQIDNAVRSADEAEALTGLPALAMIPIHQGENSGRPLEDILQRPRSSLSDAVRSLRTALELGGDGGRCQIMLITSSVPREGKTFVSLCLALLFAKAGPRVLLIDCDVHRPNLFRTIGVDGDRGLVQVLSGEAGVDEVIQRGVGGCLDFMPAGHCLNPAEVIREPQMRGVLNDLAGKYDRIIIDSPPVLAVTDTRVLARLCDRVVYLIKWNSTPRDAVRNGVKLLKSAGCAVYGVALSQVNQRKHDRYGYGDYGYYYGRYRDYYGE